MTEAEIRDEAVALLADSWAHLDKTTKGATSQKRQPDGTFLSTTTEWRQAQNAYRAALDKLALIEAPPPPPPPPPSVFDPRTSWQRPPWNLDAQAQSLHPNSQALIATWVARGNIKYPNVCTNAYSQAWCEGDKDDLHFDLRTTMYPVGKVIKNVPIPTGTKPADGTDAHLVILDTEHGREIDTWMYNPATYTAGSATEYPLGSDPPPGEGNNAAGFPPLALTIWPEEIQKGKINHALAFTVLKAAPSYVYPATHSDGVGNAQDLPEGSWLALPNNAFINAGWPAWVRVVWEALYAHGMFLMDQGGTLGIAGVSPINGGVKWSDVGMGTGGSASFPTDFPWSAMRVLAVPTDTG